MTHTPITGDPHATATRPRPGVALNGLMLDTRAGTDWLWLLAVLIVAAVPVLIFPGTGDSKRTMENITLLSAQETWLRQHGWQDIERDPNAWLMPTRNGNPRIVKPPLVIWMDMLAWTGLSPENSTAPQLIARARIVSGCMGLLTVLGVFWIGRVLGDRKLAVMAALAAGTCLFLTRQARIASYDIHMTGWATFAVASAIWALRPFAPAPGRGRQCLGWCLAGIGLAGAYMSKGPLSLLICLGPVLSTVYVMHAPDAESSDGSQIESLKKGDWVAALRKTIRVTAAPWRVGRYVAGVLCMLAVATVLTLPWYLYLLVMVPNAENALINEYQAQRPEFQTPFYYLGLIALMAPWSIWLVAGLLQPFLRASGADRRRLMIAWVWFALLFIAFSIPAAKQQRYILPVVPAAALLIGQLWRYHESLSVRGEQDPGVNLLRVPHWIAVIGVSLLVWPFFVTQGWMIERGWLEQVPVGDVSHALAASAGFVLTVLALLAARWHFLWKPMRSAVLMALWSAVLLSLVWYAWNTGERGYHPVRASAERFAEEVEGAKVAYLKHKDYPLMPNEEFLLYSRRMLPPVRPQQVPEYSQSAPRVYIATRQVRDARRVMRRNGYQRVFILQHDYNDRLDLWKFVGEDSTPEDSTASAR